MTDDPLACPAGTRDMLDDAFLAAITACTLPSTAFRHWDHVRLAWLLVRAERGRGGLEAATARMVTLIRQFAVHHSGSVEKYHETVTRAFMHLVAAHVAETPDLVAFDAFIAAHPMLLNKQLPSVFYSDALLASSTARATWVAPDLRPLPPIDG
jgi:hypothetical protein